MLTTLPYAEALAAPLEADSVMGPIVVYDEMTRIEFLLDDETGWGRVLFEGLDAIRICRGEYPPYESPVVERSPQPWVLNIRNSPWLRERHAYEARHYRTAYEFGGDVDEMLRDFRHYVFLFHDEFVEAIARGVWFESSTERLDSTPLALEHPFLELSESTIVRRVVAHDIVCQVRKNPKPMAELIDASTLCSQSLYQFAVELEGDASVAWTLRMRNTNGVAKVQWCSALGKVEKEFDGTPDLDDLLPMVHAWLGEVAARRRKMGKS